ncbi:MAG: Rrf2 family transcriptional regulator [Cyanobacteria bacterium P01_E01_bin.6]
MVLELSSKCDYCLSALIELADLYSSGQPLQIRQIAKRQNIPERYLEQLLLLLKRGGLVRSQRGMNGGYSLARDPQSISILEVIQCIDGTDNTRHPEDCAERTPESKTVRTVWGRACDAAEDILESCTLKDLINKRNESYQSQMYYI